jgi:hypothetical protein
MDSPEEIQAAHHDHRFRQTNLCWTEWLPDAVRRGNDVAVHDSHPQTARVTCYKHRLVQVWKTAGDRTSGAAATNDEHAHRAPQQFGDEHVHPITSL